MACPTTILLSFSSNPPNPRKFISSSSLPTSHLKASFGVRAFDTSHFKCCTSRRDEISSSSRQADKGPSKEVIPSGKRTVGPTNLLENMQYYIIPKFWNGVIKAKDKAGKVVKKVKEYIGGVPLLLFMLHMYVDGFYM